MRTEKTRGRPLQEKNDVRIAMQEERVKLKIAPADSNFMIMSHILSISAEANSR